jgi:hypothetical protein
MAAENFDPRSRPQGNSQPAVQPVNFQALSNYKGVKWNDDEAAARENRIAKLKEMLGR